VLVGQAARSQLLHRLLGQATIAHVALLRRPHVELHAIGGERAALLLDHSLDGPTAEALEARTRVGGIVEANAGLAILLREIDQVLAGIALLGERDVLTVLLTHPRLERTRERLELGAGVV